MPESLRTPSQCCCSPLLCSEILSLPPPAQSTEGCGDERNTCCGFGIPLESAALFVHVCSIPVLPPSPGAGIHLAVCVQPEASSAKVFCAVGRAGEAAVGLTGVQSSFRSLPHPLQQHRGLSFGCTGLQFQSGKAMLASPVV